MLRVDTFPRGSMPAATRLSFLLTPSLFCISILFGASPALAQSAIVGPETIFAVREGSGTVEAEHFYSQTKTDKRAFYLTATDRVPQMDPDGDEHHLAGASNGAYLEVLPDSRRNHGEKLIPGTNFSNEAGQLAVLSYKVHFDAPGRYYVWVRAHSTGSEDNGIHVGLDQSWPDSGNRMQWCQGKRTWRWESKQRTAKQHCGEPYKIFLDVDQPGVHDIHFSMREDGFEFDKFLLTLNREMERPSGHGPAPVVHAGASPPSFPIVAAPEAATSPAPPQPKPDAKAHADKTTNSLSMDASSYTLKGSGFYLHAGKWAAVNPDQHQQGSVGQTFPFPTGRYHVTLEAVGESDGQSSYKLENDGEAVGEFVCPLSTEMFETGPKYHKTWKDVLVTEGAIIRVTASIASADGKEFSRARWQSVRFTPADEQTRRAAQPFLAKAANTDEASHTLTRSSPTKPVSSKDVISPRKPDGSGVIRQSGTPKVWHKVTLTMDGPYAHEQDNQPNPFLDRSFSVTFRHPDGTTYIVPGFFAADGNAAESSADSGTQWRVHFTPDREGIWTYQTHFLDGKNVAIDPDAPSKAFPRYDGQSGSITIQASDAAKNTFRFHGRLEFAGQRYLQHAGSKKTFVKAGADAPETLLGYADFDGTVAGKPDRVPLKTWQPHLRDWNAGDPSWKNGKGKGLVGAINYLSSKGCNAFSFLTYNAGGDGDNVWPFIHRDDKLHYDCSKLDQWGIIFDHGTDRNMYLHFKMQETENDDHHLHARGKDTQGFKPESLDGGDLGTQRKLYCRELVARFSHALALNWNLGEENTQTTEQLQAMIDYIDMLDPYDHPIVLHTFPGQQDKQYRPLIGDQSKLTGLSLQNSGIQDTHWQTVKWVRESADSGKPWIVAFDESGTAAHGQCPDLGYQGFDGRDRTGKMVYDQHDVRRQTLWGHLMGGGAGVEYYFGYQFAENDLVCEDWRSRDQSWDYCRIALDFFSDPALQLAKMNPADELIGNAAKDGSSESNAKYCLAKPGDTYLVYLATTSSTSLDLSGDSGDFDVLLFDPRTGGSLRPTDQSVRGGQQVTISVPEEVRAGKEDNANRDWLLVVRRK